MKVHRSLNDTFQNWDLAFVVSASDLEKLLENAPEVVGQTPGNDYEGYAFGSASIRNNEITKDTHTAILINIQEIKREPIIIEQTFSAKYGTDQMLIPRELTGKRFRVTFQEIESEWT